MYKELMQALIRDGKLNIEPIEGYVLKDILKRLKCKGSALEKGPGDYETICQMLLTRGYVTCEKESIKISKTMLEIYRRDKKLRDYWIMMDNGRWMNWNDKIGYRYKYRPTEKLQILFNNY